MALWDADPQAIKELELSDAELAALAKEAPETSDAAKFTAQRAEGRGVRSRRRPFAALLTQRRLILSLGLLLSGLLVGWLVLGWWLWPVKWINTRPWDMRHDYQKQYVDLVASDYWQTGDVSRARKAVWGWNEQDLSDLLSTMVAQAPDFESRQRLTALIQILELPYQPAAPFTSLLGDRAILLSMILSMSPLFLAVTWVIAPILRDKARRPDSFLGQIIGSSIAESTGQTGELGQPAEAYPGALTDEMPADMLLGADEAEKHADQAEEAAGVATGQIKDDEEEAEDDWWEDEKESDASVGDILTSLFEEEDNELPYLEKLAGGLPQVEIGALLDKARHLSEQLKKSNALRQLRPEPSEGAR